MSKYIANVIPFHPEHGHIQGKVCVCANVATNAIAMSMLLGTNDLAVQLLRRPCCGREIQRASITGYVYDNVNILSRIGNQYYLQLCQPDEKTSPCDTAAGLRVAIEKKDVLGWSTKGKK